LVTPEGDIHIQPLYSGQEVLAHAPGSTIRLPKPRGTIAGIVGAVNIEPSGPPTIVQMYGAFAPSTESSDSVALKVLGTSVDCLATTEDAADTTTPAQLTLAVTVHGWLVDSHRLIGVLNLTKSDATIYVWDLDSTS
jgi:hypothetical protein